jgi:molybdopterin molybdotransferase
VRAAFEHSKKAGVREYLRVRSRAGDDGRLEIEKAGPQGSAMLSVLAASEGLVCLGESVTEVAPGMLLPYRSYAELLWE